MATTRPLIDEKQLAERITAMGAEIRASFGEQTPIVMIGVLKGSILFMSDLARAIPGPVEMEFLGVSSYEGTKSTGVVRISHDLRASIEGKHCLIVEDIVDTGLTLQYLRETLDIRSPASLKVASLLDKAARRKVQVEVDFVGFSIPDAFVVGYGLDLDERYRNLPYVGIYEA